MCCSAFLHLSAPYCARLRASAHLLLYFNRFSTSCPLLLAPFVAAWSVLLVSVTRSCGFSSRFVRYARKLTPYRKPKKKKKQYLRRNRDAYRWVQVHTGNAHHAMATLFLWPQRLKQGLCFGLMRADPGLRFLQVQMGRGRDTCAGIVGAGAR